MLGYRASKYFGSLIGVWFLLFGACFPVRVFCSPALFNQAVDQAIAAQDASRLPSTGSQIPTSIQTLALAAKKAFHEHMAPPISKLTALDIVLYGVHQDLFSILRDYSQKSFDDGIDALAAEGINSERTRAVENALQRFVAVRQTKAADAIFAEIVQRKSADARVAAAAFRNSVALEELPAALAKYLRFSDEPLPFPPLGEKALPAYKRAAELDPADAWTWIITALLEDDQARSEAAIRSAEPAAITAGDWRGAIFAKQLYGLLLEQRGQPAEADRVYAEALALARERNALDPSNIVLRRELARDLVWVCVKKAKRGAAAKARAACEEAVDIHKEIAAARPHDMRAQVDLIAAYGRLWVLLSDQGLQDEANKNQKEAFRIYEANQHGLVPLHNPLQSSSLPGVILIVLVTAAVLTLVLGLAILTIYRRRITRLMRAAAKISIAQNVHSIAPSIPPGDGSPNIAMRSLNADELPRASARQSEPISNADAALRKTTWAYATAGCAFAAVATLVYLLIHQFDFTVNRVMLVFLLWAWPTILTLNLLWGGNRRRLGFLLLVYFGVLLSLCIRVGRYAPVKDSRHYDARLFPTAGGLG